MLQPSQLDAVSLERGVEHSDAAAASSDVGVDGDGAVGGEEEDIDGEACGLKFIGERTCSMREAGCRRRRDQE